MSRATMARPTLAIRQVQARPIQRTACITLEAVHHNLWSDIGSYDCVHVVAPNVGGEQQPAAVRTGLNHRVQSKFATTGI